MSAPASAQALPAAGRSSINPWFIAITVTLATFMELLDTTIVNVSLPHVAGGLAVSFDESTWILSSYLVANAVILPMSAWLSRVFGRKNYYMICVTIFTASSLLCGLAPNLQSLIFCRILQGIGGGGLAPVEQAILVDTFPPAKRAAAFALYSMAIVTAPVIGPPLGGWITDHLSWRWCFFINVPIGILSLALTSQLVSDPPRFLQEMKEARQGGKLKVDYVGIGLIAIGFSALEVVLDKGQREDWLESRLIAISLAIAVVFLTAMVIWEWRHRDPVIEIRLLKERNFAIANVLYFLFSFGIIGSSVLIPQMLQSLFDYTATDAGLVLGLGTIVIVLLTPLVVRLLPKVGARQLIILSFAITACAMWRFASLTLDTDYWTYSLTRGLQGLGLACLFVPTSQLAYSYLPLNKNNKASSLTNLCRNLGGSVGVAFVATGVARRSAFHYSIVVQNLTPKSPEFRQAAHALAKHVLHAGAGATQAGPQALGLIAETAAKHSAMLASLDCFRILGAVALIGIPLALVIKPFRVGGKAA